MDWTGIMVGVVVLAVAVAGIVAVTKLGINFGRRPPKQHRVGRATNEYQPPEPREGRYWG